MICLLVAADRVHAQTAPGAPTIDSVTATATSLTVVWSAPSDDGGSAINFYDLRYIESDATDASKADDANWTLEEDAWTTGALSYEIAGLRDSTGYDVQVRAENSALAGDWSSTSTGTTNDHGATISSATAITLDSSVHGRVHVTGDEDYFELVLGSATDLLVYTTGDFDTAGAVRNSVGATTVSNDDGGLPPDPAHLAIREELAAGTWYISVGGNGAQQTGSYTLHVRAAAAASTIATATEVGLDALVPGTLSAGGVHFFRIEPTSATDLWVLAIGDTDTKGKLLDSSQSVIAQNDDSELTDNESSFSLRASVEADETYYIKVQGGDSDAAGSYILYVRSVAGPGDSSATASPLMLTVPAPGRIDATEDEDYFSLTLESTTYVLLEAHDHGGTLGLTPTLFDSQDMEIDLYYLNEGGWPAIDGKDLSLWALERLPAGTYTIRIEGATSDTGTYLLHASVAADAVAEEEACLALGTSQDDPLYGCEWHLENTGQFGSGAGYDINVEAAWETTLGEGVNVVIVDEGLDYLHSDLRGYEYESADPDDDTMGHHDITGLGVRYPGAVHGTQVAGIIAGRDNDIGVRGVAPRATIYGYNLWGGISQRPGLANEANAAAHLADVTAVSNNSWRLPSFGTMRTANSDWEMAVEEGVRSGYDGKGVFYVWIAGNGHPQNNANLDERQNHYAVTTVCAVDYNDVRAGYSELGANLWICAPSQDKDAALPGIATTSVGNTYDLNFTGTSAAAPIVSGVAALVRAANRDLFWRDVKLILATSARKNDPANTGWQDGSLKYGSADEHYSFSHEYGFGVVDAGAAVALANNWTPLPAFREVSATASPALAIPDPPSSGTADAVSSSVTLGPHVGFVEFLAIELGLTHRNYRDLRIELVSPTGATSTLLPPDVEASRSSDKRADDVTYRLGSARHLGEQAAGEWTLRITDERTGDTGRLHSWKLTAYGHGYIPDSPSITSANAGPGAITLAWTAPDDTGASAVSAYDVRYIRSAEADKADDNWTEVEDAWSSGDLEYEVGGLVGAVGYDLQVRAVNDQGAGGWSETIEATTPTVPGAAAITGVSPRDGELVVTWSAPADDGGIAIERYDLRYIESNATDKADANWTEQASIWTSTVGGDLRDLISLVNGTAYDLQVRAANGAGSGEWSATVVGTPAIQNHDPEFPATEDGARSVDENTPAGQNIGTAIAADDADSDALTFAISGADAAPFGVVESSGQLQTKGALNHESRSSYSFTMSVHDGKDTNGHVDMTVDDTITVTVTVADVDEPADISLAATGGVTVNNNALTVDESHDRTLATFTASDPERMPGLTYQWSVVGTDRLDFAITAAGVLSFAAIPDYEHPADSGGNNVYDITVNALDSEGETGELPVTVTIRDVNEVPEFPSTENGMRSVPENTLAGRNIGAPVAAVAGDNDTLTYSITSGANLFDINTATGQLVTKASLDREAAVSHTIRVGVSDGKDANNVAEDPPVVDNTISVEIAVGDEDEAPEVMGPEAVAKAENSGTSVGTYTARDPENEAVSWTTLTGADARHFAFDNGALSFVSEPDFEARPDNTYEVTVRAQDDGGHIGELRVTVTVLPVNERPTITGDAAPSVEEEGTLLIATYRATDPENATIAWLPLAGGDADKFDFSSSSGRLAFKTAPDFEDPERRGDNEYDVTLSVSAGGHAPTFDVAVTVTNKEEPGMLALPATRPREEADYTATLSDPDGVQSTTWTWERSTSRSGPWTAVSGAVNSIATSSVYTPVTGDVGDYLRATATYTDGHGPNKSGSAVSNNPVRAKPVTNNPPTFTETSPTRSIAENAGANAPVGGRVTATDPDSGDTVRYEVEPVPDLFTIDGSNGQIRVKNRGALDHETAPSHTVTVKALDSSNAFDTVQVTIEVTDVNEPPDALADAPNSFDEDTEIRIDVLANDSDPEDDRSELLLTVFNSGPNAPRNGAVTVNEPANAGENRTITYEPNADYNGADTFTYRVRDTGSPSLSSTASVSVQIDAVNDAPAFGESMPARSVSESAEAGARVGAPVTATDVDGGDTLTYSRYGADASSFEIDRQDGQITVGGGVTFDIATKNTYTLTVDASDGNGGSATVEVTITVTAGPVGPPIITGGGGGGGPSGPSPSLLDFEWNVTHDIDELDGGHDKPSGLWSDGVTLSLLENGDGADDAIYAYALESGERVEGREFELDERNRAPRGIWSDGETAWVSDSGQNHLFAHDLATGERLPERDIELADRNRDARGIWSDGATMWVLDGGKNALFAYNLESGELLAEYALDSTNGDPHGIWSDGTTFWVSDDGAKRLLAYRLPAPEEPAAEDAEPQDLERVIDEEFKELSKASNNSPRGIWSDGDVMYVADESDDKVYTYNMPDAIDARLASLTLSGVELGEFLPVRTDYRGTGGDGVTETTVTAEALQRRTSVDIDPPDADEEAEGHQVALEGTSEITVTVMSADGSRELVYRVRLRDPEPTAASGPTSHCFRGDVAAGFSLVIYEGGSIEDLLVCALSRHIVALYVLDDGVYVPYIVGAPEFVNRSFQELYADGVLPLTPFVAGSDGPPSADTAVDRPPEDELATLRGSSCLHGEIATGFSLVLYQGGSLEELATCAQGHNITALYALDEGSYFPYILGAPDFVNRSFFELFTDGLPALTPLVAKSDSPLTASADSGNAAEN